MKQETTNRARRLAEAVKQCTGRGVSHTESLKILAAVDGLRNEHVLAAHDKKPPPDLRVLIERGPEFVPFRAAFDAVLDEAVRREVSHIVVQSTGTPEQIGVWFRGLGQEDSGVGGINPERVDRFANFIWAMGCSRVNAARDRLDRVQEGVLEPDLCTSRGLYSGDVTRPDNGDYLIIRLYRTRAEGIATAIARWSGEAVGRGDMEAFRGHQELWSAMGKLPLGTSELPAVAALLAGVRLDLPTRMVANDEASKALMGENNALAVVVDAWCSSSNAGVRDLGEHLKARFAA